MQLNKPNSLSNKKKAAKCQLPSFQRKPAISGDTFVSSSHPNLNPDFSGKLEIPRVIEREPGNLENSRFNEILSRDSPIRIYFGSLFELQTIFSEDTHTSTSTTTLYFSSIQLLLKNTEVKSFAKLGELSHILNSQWV